MNKELPPGVEILGYGTLDPEACRKIYKNEKRPVCPFLEFVLQLAAESKRPMDTRCRQSACAWWNHEKGHCGVIR